MKKLICIAAVLSLSTSVMAQPVQPTEYVIRVTPQELDIVSEGLQTQPFGKVVPLINKLRGQVVEQQTPQKPPVQTPVSPSKEQGGLE